MKKINQVRWAAVFLVAAFLLLMIFQTSSFSALAQVKEEDNGIGWPSDDSDNKQVDCFDYYEFQSVQVNVGSEKSVYRAGEKAQFNGFVENSNSYPVFDGSVFVRIGRKNPRYVSEGNIIVDEFFGAEKVAVDANEKTPVVFDWAIPKGIQAGDYQAFFYFSVGKKFNLGGLPFSNEIFVGFSDFQVVSDNQSSIELIKSGTKVNGNTYAHIGDWPVVSQGEKVSIIQPLVNPNNDEKKINVAYDLFYWDSLDEKDKIDSKKEVISVPAGGSEDLSYVIEKMDRSVYYLRITATAGDQKSIVNIRIVSNQESPRLNFPALNKFPLKKDDLATLFSCFHNTSNINTEGKVQVVLADSDGKEVGRVDHSGKISAAMLADRSEIKATKDYNYLKLSAKLMDKSGKVVDQYETEYDCRMLAGGQKCSVSAPLGRNISESRKLSNILWLLCLVPIVIVLAVFVRKHSRLKIMLFWLIFSSALIFGLTATECAKASTERSKTSKATFGLHIQREKGSGKSYREDHGRVVMNGGVQVIHKMRIRDDKDDIRINDGIVFLDQKSLPSFWGEGGAWDTPNGAWCNDISLHPGMGIGDKDSNPTEVDNCTFGDWSHIDSSGGPNWANFTWTAVEPTITLISSDPTKLECVGLSCVGKKAGVATVTAIIPATTARVWAKSSINNGDGFEWITWFTEKGAGKRIRPSDKSIDTDTNWSYSSDVNDPSCAGPNINTLELPAQTFTWAIVVRPAASCEAIDCSFDCDETKVFSFGEFDLAVPNKSGMTMDFQLWGGGGGGGGDAGSTSGYIATPGGPGLQSSVDSLGIKTGYANGGSNGAGIALGGIASGGTRNDNGKPGWSRASCVLPGPGGNSGSSPSGEFGEGGPSLAHPFNKNGEAPGGGGGGGLNIEAAPTGCAASGGGGGGYTELFGSSVAANSTVNLKVGIGGFSGFGGILGGFGGRGGDGKAIVTLHCPIDSPDLKLYANNSDIGDGYPANSKLTWNSNSLVVNGTCIGTVSPTGPSWNSSKSSNGTETVNPSSATQTTFTYTLTCDTTTGGTISKTANVTYHPIPCNCTEWNVCSVTCGGGTMSCKTSNPTGCTVADKPCNTQACPQPGPDQYYKEVQP